MRRRDVIALMGAMAQEPGRTYRLGCLFSGRVQEIWNAFLDPARRHGFIEGVNLTADYRQFAQHLDLLPEWADDLAKSRVDVIVAAGDLPIRAAQKATKTNPILAMADDFIGAGLVNSMARPDGNQRASVSSRSSLMFRSCVSGVSLVTTLSATALYDVPNAACASGGLKERAI
jgi:putative tryptophan/tyrosine transport system substrate-binding protein